MWTNEEGYTVVIAFMQTIPEEGKSQKPLSYLSYEFLSFFLFNQKYTWLYLKSFAPWESDENGLIGRWAWNWYYPDFAYGSGWAAMRPQLGDSSAYAWKHGCQAFVRP